MKKKLNQNSNSLYTWKTHLGAIALSCAALLLPACANNDQAATPDSTTQVDGPEQQAENVTTQEVSEKTAALVGKPVTVRSEPIQKVGENTFTISDSQVFGGDRILVVNASGEPVQLPEPQDAQLQITGTVANFNSATVQQQYGLNLGQTDLYRNYENRPAIIAQSIALAPVPGEIAEQPQTYYNKVISVPADVENIYSPQAFTLDDDSLLGANDLLVLVTSPLKNTGLIQEGGQVVVTGTLRPFVVADLEKEYNLTWTPQVRTQLEKEYSQRPVLIAKGVYPSALPESAK